MKNNSDMEKLRGLKDQKEDEAVQLVFQVDQFALLDEIRAFAIEARFAKELASADPVHFCTIPARTFYLETETKPFFESLENSLTNGSFSRLIALHYLQQKHLKEFLSPHSFFDNFKINHKSPLTLKQVKSLKWKPELKRKIDEVLASEDWAPAN
jgi:hypothetical protein